QTLRLFKYLADTVAQDSQAPGYEHVPKHPAFGPLADQWVPEPVMYALQQREKVATTFWAQLWNAGYYIWKSSKVTWSPSTWGRNFMGDTLLHQFDRIDPVTDAAWVAESIAQFRAGIKDPHDPRAAHWLALVRENEITHGWAMEDLDALGRYVMENPTQWPAALRKFIEKHPRIVKEVKAKGARAQKVNETVGRYYDMYAQVMKLASYLKKRRKLGWNHREATRSLWMHMNYTRAGRWAKRLRRHILGQPFVMFTEQAVKITGRALRDRPVRLMIIAGAPGLLTLFSRLVLGIDDDEMDLLNTDPGRARGFVDRYFQPVLPRRGDDRKPEFVDLRWIYPLASELRVESGSHGIGLPLVLGHPFVTSAYEVLFNRDSWTGRELFDREMGDVERALRGIQHVASEMTPLPMLLHKPGRTQAGVKRMWDAYRGERDESFGRALAREVFGIRIADPWIRRVDCLRLIEKKLGRNEMEAAVHIMTLFNVIYRADTAPIGIRDAIRRARR
ncbi:MAG: hypothetical protein ACYTAN_14520, partial [Planctomycetota bacterium]